MNNKNSLGNRLLSLVVSLLLLLFSLRYMVEFYYSEKITFLSFFFEFSGILYFFASFFLFLEFLDKKITCVKEHIWLFFYLLGFIPNYFFRVMLNEIKMSANHFCKIGKIALCAIPSA